MIMVTSMSTVTTNHPQFSFPFGIGNLLGLIAPSILLLLSLLLLLLLLPPLL